MSKARGPSLERRLASTLRRLRNERDLTQENAAELAELNLRHYQKLEQGEVNATLHTLSCLCRGFEIDIIELF